jgi:hypothetical protein
LQRSPAGLMLPSAQGVQPISVCGPQTAPLALSTQVLLLQPSTSLDVPTAHPVQEFVVHCHCLSLEQVQSLQPSVALVVVAGSQAPQLICVHCQVPDLV